MDQETFRKQLLEALQKPDDWDLANGRLSHRGRGIWMPAVYDLHHSAVVSVFTGAGSILLTIPFSDAIDCFCAVQRRNREAQEARDEQNRRAFLDNFGGFEQ